MTIWHGQHPLILASQSRARQMLLANAGISFEAVPADIEERAVQKNSGLSAPGEIAGLLAGEKAGFVSSKNPGRYVIGADQTLALGSRLFSKPAGRAQAADQLRLLAGQTHELHAVVRHHEPVRVAIGERAEQHAVHEREDRDGGTYPDDECQRCGEREGGAPAEGSPRRLENG